MPQYVTVGSINTESGGQSGFHKAFKAMVDSRRFDIIALQEVHRANCSSVPELYTPRDPGKRENPIRLRLFNELREALSPNYHAYFAPHMLGLHDLECCSYDVEYGQALFVHKSFGENPEVRSGFVYGQLNQFNTEATGGTPSGKVAIGTRIVLQSGDIFVLLNVHGFWSKQGKVDLDTRFEQNEGINKLLQLLLDANTAQTHVLCVGDLNYRSDMKVLEDLRTQPAFMSSGGVVLNHKFEVTRTRTDFYRNWANEPEADFMIASKDLADKVVYLKADLTFPSDHGWLTARLCFN